MGVSIFLDDIRKEPEGYIRTYTVEDTISELIKNYGNIDCLSLDNDLGEMLNEGYKVLDWLEEQFILNDNYILPSTILVHSSNAAARLRMQSVINKLYEMDYKRSNTIAN